ncbi:MAG: hypothetical protein SV375_08445 [Thermodesulfobacteriota bacterium]|nr:hypothetical protein [Thermodesulfobacteriota bacterium]
MRKDYFFFDHRVKMNSPALKEKDRACTRIGASCTFFGASGETNSTLFAHFREIKMLIIDPIQITRKETEEREGYHAWRPGLAF